MASWSKNELHQIAKRTTCTRDVEDWIGPAEVADRLKVSRATVYALVKSGQLRHRRVGLQIRVPLSALVEFLSGSR